MKIETKKTKKGKYYFLVLAGNRKQLLKSGHYANKRNHGRSHRPA